MAGINDIVARGFGSWAGVNDIPTRGFGSSTIIVVTQPGFYRPEGTPVAQNRRGVVSYPMSRHASVQAAPSRRTPPDIQRQ